MLGIDAELGDNVASVGVGTAVAANVKESVTAKLEEEAVAANVEGEDAVYERVDNEDMGNTGVDMGEDHTKYVRVESGNGIYTNGVDGNTL